ncbi:MAG TPA: rod shape-determining protein MreD [Desulfuromonadales bacterium]|nr:rod shape-determining protein MreD [Desulfuromonadales bacterium]
MTRTLVYFPLGFIFLVLQTTLLPPMLPLHFKPDLLLILVVYLGLNEGYVRGGALSYLLGCLQDVFAAGYPGLHGLALLCTFLAVRGAAARLNTESPVLLLLLVSAGTLLQAALVLFALGFFAEAGALWMIILKGILPQLLLNLLAACLLLRAAAWLQRRFAPRSRVPGLRGVGRHYGS